MELNGYNLTKNFFDFKFNNPNTLKPSHTEVYFFIVDLWNRLGKVDQMGLPTFHVIEQLSINRKTFRKCLADLEYHGFIQTIHAPKNQETARVISLTAHPKIGQAYGQALGQATGQPTGHLIKQGNEEMNGGAKKSASGGKGKNKQTEPHHNKLKSLFLDKYKSLKGEPYYWQAKDAKNLNQLANKIRFKIEAKGNEVTEDNLIKGLDQFLTRAHEGDQWVADNFSIPTLNSKFNELFERLIHKGRQDKGPDISPGDLRGKAM